MKIDVRDKNVFVCAKCGLLEALDSVLPNSNVITDDEYTWHDAETMMSEGNIMLCSKCNTGIESEFRKQLTDKEPNINERAIASFSKYNFITQFDHPEGTLIEEPSERFGHKLNKAPTGIYNQIVMYAIDNNVKNISVTQHPLYNKWVEEGDDFDINEIINFNGDIGKHIREMKLNGGAILDNVATDEKLNKLADGMAAKDVQSEEDKEKRLKLAEIKRKIKSLKKELPTADRDSTLAKISELRKEYRDLKG